MLIVRIEGLFGILEQGIKYIQALQKLKKLFKVEPGFLSFLVPFGLFSLHSSSPSKDRLP